MKEVEPGPDAPASSAVIEPSVRTSLRIGRPHRSVPVLFSALAVAITTALVWALASAVPSTAGPQADYAPHPSADRLAGPKVGLHPRVRQVDAAAMSERTAKLAEAQQVAEQAAFRAQVAAMREQVIKVARKQLGDPYRAGAAGPNAFDCGGFTQFVFQRALGMDIARSSRGQYQQVERIKKKDARAGDLVFFFEGGAHHVGIYLGNGKMIDAPNPGEAVSVNPISGSWWGRSFTGIGRLLPA
jgi:cell wall-associated NlpC family hydrolase